MHMAPGAATGDGGTSEEEFRREIRHWLAPRLPMPPVPVADEERHAFLRTWQRELFDAGFVGVSFPIEYGGRGLTPVFDAILLEELGLVGAPAAFNYGYVARILLDYGTSAQRTRYIIPALRGDEEWCQGFSEPDAGSDLAAVRTRAVRQGDRFVVTGQKVWTSRAHLADWCLLLVRTGASGGRHRGLSCIILPIESPGLTVRPLRQMTGGLEFAELFLDEVDVPVSNVVGQIDDGWRVAMSTVAYERGPSDIGKIADLRRRLLATTQELAVRICPSDHPLALKLGQVFVAVEVLNAHVQRTLRNRERGIGNPSDTSVDKLLVSETDQLLARFEMDIFGVNAVNGRAPHAAFDYLDARAASIYGGSTQIQRHIIATSVLGLPKG
jgi:alkylation response protein AidB-like acyl-CoA dehydrogenase